MIKAVGSNPHSSFKCKPAFTSASNNSLSMPEIQTKKQFLNIPKKDWLAYSALGVGFAALAGSHNHKYGKENGVKNLKAHTAVYATLGFLLPLVLLPLGRMIDRKLHPEQHI